MPYEEIITSSKTAASGGTDLSLVTTGEKYIWNNKGSGTITGITMNGASKGTSGTVDLGTVITSHQSLADYIKAYQITGTGSTAGTWLGSNSAITALADGLFIMYKIPIAGASTTTLNINSLGAKTVYLYGSTKLTTQYPVNAVLLLRYNSSLNSGCWEVVNGGDTNTTYSSKAAESGGTATSLVTTGEKYTWNNKYSKPSTGIPSTDLAQGVQNSLGLAAYAASNTAADVSEKVVTVHGADDWTLKTGCIICVKHTNTNTASNPTLNVNNSGAKSIIYGSGIITTSSVSYAAEATCQTIYMYDGTNWVWIGHNVDNNTTYTNAALGQGYGTCTTAAATTAKVVTLSSYVLTTGGIVSVKFSYDVPASATMNINGKGAKSIYYKGAAIPAGVIKAGAIATFIYSTQYHLISIDRNVDKVQKTEIVSANKTTSTIAIDDDSQMVMVAKISGKTVKSPNLSNLFDKSQNTRNGITYSVTNNVIKASGASSGDGDIPCDMVTPFSVANGEKFTISLKNANCPDGVSFFCWDTISNSFKYSASTGANCTATITATANSNIRQILVRVTSTHSIIATNGYLMIEKGSVSTDYMPAEVLWNASVESVLSQHTENVLLSYGYIISGTGVKTVTTLRGCSEIFPLDGIKKIKFTVASANGKACSACIREFDASNKMTVDGAWMSGTATYTIASPDTKKIAMFVKFNDDSTVSNGSITVSWNLNKTTVLVPSSVKNLPDYGLGIVKSDGTIVANEVDFENGVYHHRVAKWKPASTIWVEGDSSTAPTHVYTSVPSDAKKVTDYLWICNMYSQVTNTWWNNNASTRDKVFASGNNGGAIQLVDRSCTTLDQYKTKLANVEFVYELASDDVKPLSDYLRPLPVENGGTLTLVNEHNLDMPSVIKYKKEV